MLPFQRFRFEDEDSAKEPKLPTRAVLDLPHATSPFERKPANIPRREPGSMPRALTLPNYAEQLSNEYIPTFRSQDPAEGDLSLSRSQIARTYHASRPTNPYSTYPALNGTPPVRSYSTPFTTIEHAISMPHPTLDDAVARRRFRGMDREVRKPSWYRRHRKVITIVAAVVGLVLSAAFIGFLIWYVPRRLEYKPSPRE